MNSIALVFGFAVLSMPQPIEKQAGDIIVFTVQLSDQADSISIYRKTGVTTMPSKIGSIPVVSGTNRYEFQYVMPGGTTKMYRFFAVPIRGFEFLEESNGVRVK